MATFDAIISETSSQFGMGNATSTSLLSGLLTWTSEQTGGLAGVLDRCRQFGLGYQVSSWLGGGTRSISPEDLTATIGKESLERIASRAGLTTTVTIQALAF